jgi:hypothetical protein
MLGFRPRRLFIAGLLVAACGKPFWKGPPPPPEPVFPARLLNAAIDSVSLTQTPCMAPCPTYCYVLRGDGTARYEGQADTPILGRYSAPLGQASFDSLVRMLREKHFLQLARRYEYPATDQDSKITRVFLADTVKAVHRYGVPADTPPELYQIEAAIEGLGAGLTWEYRGSNPPDRGNGGAGACSPEGVSSTRRR